MGFLLKLQFYKEEGGGGRTDEGVVVTDQKLFFSEQKVEYQSGALSSLIGRHLSRCPLL